MSKPSIRGHGRPRPKKQDPIVSDVVPEVVQTPAPQALTAPGKPKRVRTAANIAAEQKYLQKKREEAKARKEAEAAELARPLPELWEKNRTELQQRDPEAFQALYNVDEELCDLLHWVRNVEQGVKLGLQPGDGWRDQDFNSDGTFKDELKPTMRHPLEVLAEVREARKKYGDINIPPTMEDARKWSDFKERRMANKAAWDYGYLSGVPVDTEWRVLTAIADLMNRGDVFDEELAKVAREFRPKAELPDRIKVSCDCGRAAEVWLPITDMQRLQLAGQPYRCGLCAKERAARLEDHAIHMDVLYKSQQWGFSK